MGAVLGPRQVRRKDKEEPEQRRYPGEPRCPPSRSAIARHKAEALRDLLELERLVQGARRLC